MKGRVEGKVSREGCLAGKDSREFVSWIDLREAQRIHQLSALGTGELFAVIDALNFRYGSDHVVPVVPLRSKRPEEARHIAQVSIS